MPSHIQLTGAFPRMALNVLRQAHHHHLVPATVQASLARRRRLLALQGLTNPLIIASVAASATVRAKRAKGRCNSQKLTHPVVPRRNALSTHLDVHNNVPEFAAAAAAATIVVVVSPLAGQHNEPVRCTISFRWWLTGCEHAEYSVPIVLYVLVCDYLTVLAGAVLCATLWALARALLCSPGTTIKRPLSGVSFAWLVLSKLAATTFLALCGTDNGKGVTRMLGDHPGVFGRRLVLTRALVDLKFGDPLCWLTLAATTLSLY
ncbi:hypothetical protein MY8738_008329 [Beauveria namnaoensis]